MKRGVYAVNFGGGQVDITNGKFVFSASEAYLVEDGQITAPIKGATLIGNGPDVLTRVSMVGNDLKLDEGVGTCGKDGQAVPVGVGIPTFKVDRLTVGGTAMLIAVASCNDFFHHRDTESQRKDSKFLHRKSRFMPEEIYECEARLFHPDQSTGNTRDARWDSVSRALDHHIPMRLSDFSL